MYYKLWLIFSYTVPAKNPNVRVKAWRRLQAVGAVQLKSSLYVLPFSETNYEHFQWLAREVEDLGGEAVFFHCPAVENLTDTQIKALFGKVRDEDYSRLHEEIQAFARSLENENLRSGDKAGELHAGFKKITRKLQTIREIDFFPTGQGERTALLLSSLEERLLILSGEMAKPTPAPLCKKEDYQGKTWVTRRRPYIDRLASFWLVQRFIDPDASVAFIPPREKIRRDPGLIHFDMAGAEFTHREGLITFEVLAGSFGLVDQGVAHVAALVRAIDLKEDLAANREARTLKDLMDGLLAITPDDRELVERALIVFNALYATYQGSTP